MCDEVEEDDVGDGDDEGRRARCRRERGVRFRQWRHVCTGAPLAGASRRRRRGSPSTDWAESEKGAISAPRGRTTTPGGGRRRGAATRGRTTTSGGGRRRRRTGSRAHHHTGGGARGRSQQPRLAAGRRTTSGGRGALPWPREVGRRASGGDASTVTARGPYNGEGGRALHYFGRGASAHRAHDHISGRAPKPGDS